LFVHKYALPNSPGGAQGLTEFILAPNIKQEKR